MYIHSADVSPFFESKDYWEAPTFINGLLIFSLSLNYKTINHSFMASFVQYTRIYIIILKPLIARV